MTPPPEPGGDPGKYHEAFVQWLLEHTFFIDFVYRNPSERNGQGELGDAVVLFDDVALMVQVKAQSSAREPIRWAKKELKKAVKQLRHTDRMLFKGHVRELESPLFGKVPFHAGRYSTRIGLIVVAQGGSPYSAETEVPEVGQTAFPVHVLSLRDFLFLIERFDTAGDFVSYLEFRYDMRRVLDRRVHAEAITLHQIADRIGDFLKIVRPGTTPELLERSARYFRLTALGQWGDEYRYSLAIDDIIAHLHDEDVSLPWNSCLSPSELAKITAPLAWLDRRRRIALGKMLLDMCEAAAVDGQVHYRAHFQRASRVAFVFLVSAEPREQRVRHLPYLVEAAQAEFDAGVVVGISTGPLGKGRSYDLCYREGSVAAEVKEFFRKEGSPFGEFAPLFE